DERARARRQRRHHDLLRASRDPRHVRSRARHAPRPHRRRVHTRRGHERSAAARRERRMSAARLRALAAGGRRELAFAGLTLLLFGAVTVAFPGFAAPRNLAGLLDDTAILVMLALGQMLVILARGIDLSVAANLALCGMLAALFNRAHPGAGVLPAVLLAAGA